MSSKRLSRRSRAARRTRLRSLERLEHRRLLAADLLDSSVALAAELAPPLAGDAAAPVIAANLQAMNAPEAWAAGHTGRGVLVAVVDSGVALDHPDLHEKLWSNPGEIPGNGADDDGNGFVDDTTGWDFVGRDNRPDDRNGHGTHIAGTIAAGGTIQGVAPDATLLPVRVLDSSIRGSNSDIAAGIRYAVNAGADIINLSVGGANSATVHAALQFAQQHDVLVVAAAGNTKGAAPLYPAAHSATLSNVLSVGASATSGSLAPFSSRVAGSGAVQVDAPGQDIKSTFVSAPYGFQSGTSMAAPHAAGLAALALAADPSLTAPELRELIVQGATRTVPGSDARGGIDAAATLALVMSGRAVPPVPPVPLTPPNAARSQAPAPRPVIEKPAAPALPVQLSLAADATESITPSLTDSPPPPAQENARNSSPAYERIRQLARAHVAESRAALIHDRAILAWQFSEDLLGLAQLQHWSRQELESNDSDWFDRRYGFAQLSLAAKLQSRFTRS